MPPPDAHKILTERQKQLIKKWISQGAKYEDHWAYQKVSRPAGLPAETAKAADLLIAKGLKEAGLAASPAASRDRYVLLDAQDWMTDQQLTALWTQITRTARPGARVLFRTAAEETLLPGRVPQSLLSQWNYSEEQARELIKADRSSIYGGLHLYRLRP